METIREPYIQDLAYRGVIQGVTIKTKATDTSLCRYFGGLRYALAPPRRWERARPLPEDYSYGTRENPGQQEGGAAICPQTHAWDTWNTSEDCFQCNVWVPVERSPPEGWPVLFFIHGGFLQFGTPNAFSLARLLGETDFRCVVVMPAYRLGVLGFLASEELNQEAATRNESSGNQGFWDQRLALEWTCGNIHLFSGDPSNITVSGYSAGAYSAFYQLAYDIQFSEEKSIIQRAIMWSNGPGVQPKSLSLAQIQFNELLSTLGISHKLPLAQKLSTIRELPAQKLLDAVKRMVHHQFRPGMDSAFVSRRLFHDIDNGSFGRRMRTRGVRLMIGECRDEHIVYGAWIPPKNDSLASLRQRLEADYPPDACDALVKLYYPTGELPKNCKDWLDAFGRLYADIQVHMLERGLINALAQAEAGHNVYRYRIEYRAKCLDKTFPYKGVTHATDVALWFWGNGDILEDEEKIHIEAALIKPLTRFVQGKDHIQWNTKSYLQARRLRPDMKVDNWDDIMWEDGAKVWNVLRNVGSATGKLSANL